MMNDHTSEFRNVRFLAGPIHAGFPSPADDWREKRLDVNDLVVPHPVSTYFMRVEGNSMNGACIDDQDIVVVDRAITATHNKIVVARLGEDFTLKRLQVINGRKIFLKSENPAYPAIEVSSRADFEIWGCVTYVIHRLTGSRHTAT
jgi:DNA polymerase V